DDIEDRSMSDDLAGHEDTAKIAKVLVVGGVLQHKQFGRPDYNLVRAAEGPQIVSSGTNHP
ncbi:MAG: hypothetical protein P8Y44_05130, partial [Acidobacteriota bacterium]